MTNPESNRSPVGRESKETTPLWVSGVHGVKEVLRAKPDQVDLIVLVGRHPSHRMFIAMAREHGIPYTTAEERLPEPLRRKKHAPVFARLAAFRYAEPEDLWETIRPTTMFLVLDHVQDPTNLGNVMRTAAGAGAQGIFIPRHRGVRMTPAVAHIASGALPYVPVARYGSLQQLIQQLQERGVWVVAADPYAPEPWFALKGDRPIALVLGHEGEGVTKTALQLCDQTVRIPMAHLESLNVAASAAILLYEVIRQRMTCTKSSAGE